MSTTAAFLTPFVGSATNVALPAIGRDLSLGAVGLSWVATTYLLSAAAFLVPLGKLADIHGRRAVFVRGLAVYGLTSLGCALAPSAPWLLAGRAAQGLGGAMIFGTSVALLTSVFPPERRGAALGVNVAAVYLGLSLGPFLGGVMTSWLGWRSVFWANAVLGVLTALVAARGLRGEWAEARDERLDVAGSLLYGTALVLLMLGLGSLPGGRGAILLGGGGLLLLAFLLWERRTPHPVLDVGLLLGNRVFALSNAAALVNYAATFAVGFLLSLFLQEVEGLSAPAAGTVLVMQPALQALVSPFAGRLSDRVEARYVASTGMGLIAVGLAALSFVGAGTPRPLILGCLAFLGCGFGLFSSPNTNAVMGSVERRSYGVASATLATMRLVGQMLSMGMAALALGLLVGHGVSIAERPEAFVTAMRACFVVFALLCVLGGLASLARGNTLSEPR